MINALSQYNHLMPRDIWRWRDDLINSHLSIRSELIAHYIRTAKKAGYVAANIAVRKINEALKTERYLPGRMSIVECNADIDDDEIKVIATECAENCKEIFMKHSGMDFQSAVESVSAECDNLNVQFPCRFTKNDNEEKKRTKLAGACARCCDEKWWRRQLRKKMGRQVEQVLRSIGAVQKAKQPYVSDWALKRWQSSSHRNRCLLENMVAENEKGFCLSLAEASDLSVSNPVNMRNELMVRMRGYEEIADAMSLSGLFLTLTCPGAYHSRHHHGAKNSNYNGATPKEAMDYLCEVWSRIRSAWKKRGIKPFGFRVAEPHHDGTPHWHMLLFFSKEDADKAWLIFRDHALAVDGHEPGAQQHRAVCEHIDPERGSATGYLAKYIAKNIDGFGVGTDDEAQMMAAESAVRTKAWSSIWGIRQFQQIGAVSVTVWRELRRKKKPLEQWEPEEAEAIRAACDNGDWAAFVELMGGPVVAREDQVLRPFHFVGGEQYSRYGEAVRRILGVVMRGVGRVGRMIRTREHVWKIKFRAGESVSERGQGAHWLNPSVSSA